MTQKTQIQLKQETELAKMLNVDDSFASALKNSIFPGAKDESIRFAWDYCKARGLDVMKKPCHIVGMSVSVPGSFDKKEWRDVIMPGIAEARTTAMRTGKYMGQSEPEFGPMVELKIGSKKHEVPEWCKITVYRLENGEKVPYPHIEYFEEAYADKKNGDLNSMWTKRKRGQLAKCVEAGALRKAFPEELGGEIVAEEANPNFSEMKPATPAEDEPINPFGEKPKELPEVSENANPPKKSITPEDYKRIKMIEEIGELAHKLNKTAEDWKKVFVHYGAESLEAMKDIELRSILAKLKKEMPEELNLEGSIV